MQQTYLLVEGINIYPNVLDTDQLSVIRGSGLILKKAIDAIQNHFESELEAISTGASSGIFRLKNSTQTEGLVQRISKKLQQEPYAFFTFALEHCQANSLLAAKERLLTQMRFHQMSGINTVPDHFSQAAQQDNKPCELEGRRIAAKNLQRTVQGRTRTLSPSVFARLLEGRALRQTYYFDENAINQDEPFITALKQKTFTDDLQTLAKNEAYSKLNHKIAVVYMDGNRFSKIQNEYLQAASDQVVAQKHFDTRVKEYRAEFLKNILADMLDEGSSRFPAALVDHQGVDETVEVVKEAIRFETLLWGGDEMTFVVPAWNGFELLQRFFELSKSWTLNGNTDSAPQALTHAAGIVFCSAKTPIRIITALAHELADRMKNRLGESGRVNVWDYLVLESVDYPVDKDIACFNKRRYGEELSMHRSIALKPVEDWQQTQLQLKQLIAEGYLSRRQIHRIVEAIIQQQSAARCSWNELLNADSADQVLTPQDQAERRMLLLLEHSKRQYVMAELLSVAQALFQVDLQNQTERRWFWLHLAELWDYLIPVKSEMVTEEGVA